jgi:hypothetical protein
MRGLHDSFRFRFRVHVGHDDAFRTDVQRAVSQGT